MCRTYCSESCLRNHSVESRVGENHTHGLVGEVEPTPRMEIEGLAEKLLDFFFRDLVHIGRHDTSSLV